MSDIPSPDSQYAALEILYRDEHLVAINKPAGLLVHRSPIDRQETRFALQMLRDQIGQHVYPVHRLDKPTSGVLLFALSSNYARLLSAAFCEQTITKNYLAVVRGFIAERGEIDHPLKLEQDKYSDRKARSDKPAQTALSRFERLATIEIEAAIDRYPQSRFSLVRLSPVTGRKHQLRRHMKHIAHSIIGDAKHGKGRYNHYFKEHFDCGRLLLTCTQMTVPQLSDAEPITISAPLDQQFEAILDRFDWPLPET